MAGSLGDQLLKAGVVDKKKAKQIKHQQRNQTQKNKAKSAGKEARTENTGQAQKIEQAMREKQQRDRELNKQRDRERAQKASIAEGRQIVQQHQVDIPESAEVAYNFTYTGKVKKIYVTEEQQKQLTLGQLAIALSDQSYYLIPDKIAEKLEKRLPEMVIRISPDDDHKPDEDDPYADYEIPDDLMW